MVGDKVYDSRRTLKVLIKAKVAHISALVFKKCSLSLIDIIFHHRFYL